MVLSYRHRRVITPIGGGLDFSPSATGQASLEIIDLDDEDDNEQDSKSNHGE